jgi:hypothetical protein
MALGIFMAYGPIADSSIPPLAAIEERAHEREFFSSDFGEADIQVEHLRGLSLFGLLLALEGFFFSFVAETSLFNAASVGLILFGFLVFLLGSAIVPEVGQGFGWAIVAAAATAVGLGMYVQFNPMLGPLSLATLWSTGAPNFLENAVRFYQLGGAVISAVALAVSFWAARRVDVE